MREIKFRAWDKINKEMAFVDTICMDEGHEYIDTEKGTLDWDDEKTVLMQFTGLTDRKGNLIYEGDILGFGVLSEVVNSVCPHLDLKPEKCEIIGNIYEHPDLLK